MQIYNVVRKDGVVSLRSVKPARASPVEIFQYVLPLPLNMPSQSRGTLVHSAAQCTILDPKHFNDTQECRI